MSYIIMTNNVGVPRSTILIPITYIIFIYRWILSTCLSKPFLRANLWNILYMQTVLLFRELFSHVRWSKWSYYSFGDHRNDIVYSYWWDVKLWNVRSIRICFRRLFWIYHIDYVPSLHARITDPLCLNNYFTFHNKNQFQPRIVFRQILSPLAMYCNR